MSKTATLEETRKLYNEVRDYIQEAREIAERGEFTELHSLDERVHGLCTQMQHMKVRDAQVLKDDLDVLMKDLTELQELFMAQRELLSDEITGVGKHKHAAKAYKQQEVTSILGTQGKKTGEE